MRAWMLSDPKTLTLREDVTEDELPDGDVLVEVAFSTLNYKDALALTGRGKIARAFPMVPGIDVSGRVVKSSSDVVPVGAEVVLNGYGLGENRWGGFAEQVRVPADWPLTVPKPFSLEDAMRIGTAGYTAALCVMAVEEGGARPGEGEVLVTGSTGGVGSVAVMLLAARGHTVWAVTGRPQHGETLRELGAAEVIDRAELEGKTRPLGSQRWSAAIDVAGGRTLANVLSMTKYDGVVAATGLADGMELPGFVTPFILRNVRLQGVESGFAPRPRREKAWALLAAHLDPKLLRGISETVAFEDLPDKARGLLDGEVRGRVVVRGPSAAPNT